MIRSGIRQSLLVCLGLAVGDACFAASDDNTAASSSTSHALNPARLSALIAAASGQGADKAGSSTEQLQHTLDLNGEVVIALLQVVDETGIKPDNVAKNIAQSAGVYHEVTSRLGAMEIADPDPLVTKALAAMNAGRFADAEVHLHQLEDREIASSVREPSASSADPHRFMAAQVRTLLGKIAIMRLQFETAAKDFDLARRYIDAATSPQPVATEPPKVPVVAGVAEPPRKGPTEEAPMPSPERARKDASEGAADKPAGYQEAAVAKPPQPQPQSDAPVQITPLSRPVQGKAEPQTDTAKPVAGLSSQDVSGALSPDVVEQLLRRGDAMLALGDLASARLLYERAAAAGAARGATGAGKTYDPRFLAKSGARGIRADPATAANWYRKALELGDASAAVQLRELGQ
jgi:hypothetical protein